MRSICPSPNRPRSFVLATSALTPVRKRRPGYKVVSASAPQVRARAIAEQPDARGRRVQPSIRRSPRMTRVLRVITIALADHHHHLIQQGVRLLLETAKDFEVIGEVADGLKVAGLVERRKPRVLIVASGIPGHSRLPALGWPPHYRPSPIPRPLR